MSPAPRKRTHGARSGSHRSWRHTPSSDWETRWSWSWNGRPPRQEWCRWRLNINHHHFKPVLNVGREIGQSLQRCTEPFCVIPCGNDNGQPCLFPHVWGDAARESVSVPPSHFNASRASLHGSPVVRRHHQGVSFGGQGVSSRISSVVSGSKLPVGSSASNRAVVEQRLAMATRFVPRHSTHAAF